MALSGGVHFELNVKELSKPNASRGKIKFKIEKEKLKNILSSCGRIPN